VDENYEASFRGSSLAFFVSVRVHPRRFPLSDFRLSITRGAKVGEDRSPERAFIDSCRNAHGIESNEANENKESVCGFDFLSSSKALLSPLESRHSRVFRRGSIMTLELAARIIA